MIVREEHVDMDLSFDYLAISIAADELLIVVNARMFDRRPVHLRQTLANEALRMLNEPGRARLAEVIDLEERRAALTVPAAGGASASQAQVTDA